MRTMPCVNQEINAPRYDTPSLLSTVHPAQQTHARAPILASSCALVNQLMSPALRLPCFVFVMSFSSSGQKPLVLELYDARAFMSIFARHMGHLPRVESTWSD